MTAFLEARAVRVDGGDPIDARWTGPAHDYRFEPVGEETVVLLAGSEGFVDTAAATGTADDVAIAVPSE